MTVTAFDPARQICHLGYLLHGLSLVPSPRGVAMMRDMDNPKPGDLVLEVSALTWVRKESPHTDCLGRMVLKRSEFVPHKDEPGGYHDNFTYIETLDGRLFRWSNCRFIKLPEKCLDNDHEPDHSAWLADALHRHKDDFYDRDTASTPAAASPVP
jgi:hypothetical protein